MHEELWGEGEPDLRPVHPRVSHTPVPAFDPIDARGLDPWADTDAVHKAFVECVDQMINSLTTADVSSLGLASK